MDKKEITLTITMEEVQLIFNGLGELKAGMVFNLLNKLQQQIQPQLQSAPSENMTREDFEKQQAGE